MGIKKEFIIISCLILFLFFIGFLTTTKDILTGEVGKIGILTRPLEENEYLLYIKQSQTIHGKLVELLEVTDNKDIIIRVNNKIKSVSDKIIINNGLQIKKNVAVKEDNYESSFAVLEIIKVKQDKLECRQENNICYDDYYEMGVENFCDGSYLKKYSCEYDEYVDKVHCMKETIKCENRCKDGRCIGLD